MTVGSDSDCRSGRDKKRGVQPVAPRGLSMTISNKRVLKKQPRLGGPTSATGDLSRSWWRRGGWSIGSRAARSPIGSEPSRSGISISTGPTGLSSRLKLLPEVIPWSGKEESNEIGVAPGCSLCLIALKAVPAPEILSAWSGIFGPRDSHVGVGLAFCTNFHLAVHRVNLLR